MYGSYRLSPKLSCRIQVADYILLNAVRRLQEGEYFHVPSR